MEGCASVFALELTLLRNGAEDMASGAGKKGDVEKLEILEKKFVKWRT